MCIRDRFNVDVIALDGLSFSMLPQEEQDYIQKCFSKSFIIVINPIAKPFADKLSPFFLSERQLTNFRPDPNATPQEKSKKDDGSEDEVETLNMMDLNNS